MWPFALIICLLAGPLAAQPVALEINSTSAQTRLQQRFRALARDPAAPPLHILHIGDSHTAASAFSGQLRSLIQQRFGDSGPGLLAPGGIPQHGPGPLPLRQSDGWVAQLERKPASPASGALGGFFAYSQRPYQFLGTRLPNAQRASRLILYTDPESTATPPRYKVFHDQHEIPPITRSTDGRSFYALPAGQGQLEILSSRGGGATRLRALSLLHAAPGISYSTIGVNGARFGSLLDWTGPVVRMQMADYHPELLLLAFGTNDVVAPDFSQERCLRTLQQTELWIREYAPTAAILILLPPGLPRHGASVQANLATQQTLIRSMARKNGWFVWDWPGVMAGQASGTAYAPDGIHLTSRAYADSARQLFEALTSLF